MTQGWELRCDTSLISFPITRAAKPWEFALRMKEPVNFLDETFDAKTPQNRTHGSEWFTTIKLIAVAHGFLTQLSKQGVPNVSTPNVFTTTNSAKLVQNLTKRFFPSTACAAKHWNMLITSRALHYSSVRVMLQKVERFGADNYQV